VIHALYKFGDDGVHVRVAFAVRVRGEVQGHIVEENGEVGTVVEIEAAKKILVGFAAAGVLGDDDTGNRFQDFSRTTNGTSLDFGSAGGSLGGGIGNPDEAIVAALHVDGGVDGTDHERNAQRDGSLGGSQGEGHFFGFKTGIRYHQSIIAGWKA